MKRQVLVIQKAPRTVDIPLLQYSDTTVDVPVAKDAEKTPETAEDSESRTDSSFTVLKDTEVIHREVKGGTKINCDLKEN